MPAEEWGKFDVDFVNDERFLAMPEAVRSQAYLLLLAFSGWAQLHRTDGEVPRVVALDLQRRIWPNASEQELLLALRKVRLLTTGRATLRLRRYDKWGRTTAQIAASAEAGKKGAEKRWGVDREPHRVAIGSPIAEKRDKTKRERPRTPPKAPPSSIEAKAGDNSAEAGGNGVPEENRRPAAILVQAFEVIVEHAATPRDRDVAEELLLTLSSRMTLDAITARMEAHVAHCIANDLPVPRTLAGFMPTLRSEDVHLADARRSR